MMSCKVKETPQIFSISVHIRIRNFFMDLDLNNPSGHKRLNLPFCLTVGSGNQIFHNVIGAGINPFLVNHPPWYVV